MALIVTPQYLPLLGGMERECALLAEEFDRRGFDPVVVTEQLGMDVPRVERSGPVEVRRVPSSPRRTLAVQLRVAFGIALLVLRRRRGTAFAIVRTATLPAVVVGVLKALRLVRFPTLVTAETGGDADDVVALANRPLFAVSRRLMSANDRLNGICQANSDHLREYGFPLAKITSIPNGVDTGPWLYTRPPERVRRLLYLGRLDPEKGLFELLEAVASIVADEPDVSLTLAGSGPAERELMARCSALGVGAEVNFRGRVPYEQVGALLSEHDCLVLPSYSEGMPLSVLEAAVHHRVMVLSDVGDVRRLFGDRVHICAPRDVASLAAAIKAAIAETRPVADYQTVIDSIAIEAVAGALLSALGVDTISESDKN